MMMTELPFGLPGRVFTSPMPFGFYDKEGTLLQEYKDNGVSVVVLLADDEECHDKSNRNLRMLYLEEGFEVIALPMLNGGVPKRGDLGKAIRLAVDHARAGRSIAIHCSAGIGRTGLFAACMVRQLFGLGGEEAIAWVRQYIRLAVETPQQREMIVAGCD